MDNITREGDSTTKELYSKLQKNYSFFTEMNDQEIACFFRLCRRSTFNTGEKIFEMDQTGECFYIIVFGKVAIKTKEKEIARLGPGQVFGEMAILEKSVRSATAMAVEKTLVFGVDRQILSDIMPKLGYRVAVSLARDLSNKLRIANEKL